ncbi:MAG: hypothetical protein HYV09_35375 [Deltaproteobacteria bacterium]|nr:hypothetical protein [Deltaproteobacteria bacterium]
MRNEHGLLLGTILLAVAASCSEDNTTVPPATADSSTDSRSDTTTPTDTLTTDAPTDTAVEDVSADAGAKSISLKAVQDPSDPDHPAKNAKVNLTDTDLVALTPRVLIGSSSAAECRFAVWIGKPGGGDFAGVQVQELITRGSATNCFGVTPGKIPSTVKVGDAVTAVDGANYGEFCAGPSGTPATACGDFEQSQLFLGGAAAKITFGSAGTAPTPTTVTVADLVADAAGKPGPRAPKLEGTLVSVAGVKVDASADGGITTAYVLDASDSTGAKKLEIQISNFTSTSCVRTYFVGKSGSTIDSITGVLVPDFGRWKIRLRDDKDVSGTSCVTGDAGTDAASDAASDAADGG